MNSRDILPILLQYAVLLVPVVITVVGVVLARLAITYNARVKNQHVRDTVSTIVKAVEMQIAGSAEKKARAVALVHGACPFLSETQANQLVEAAVFDLDAWQAQTGYLAPPQQPTATATPLELQVLRAIPPPVQQVVITHRVEQAPAPTAPPAEPAPPPLVLPTVTPAEQTPPPASTPG